MKIRYYVCGLGYNKNYEAINYECEFGDFDTYEEAYELFVKLQCRNAESFFVDTSEVYEIDIRLEECEETDIGIECIEIRNEYGVVNPDFNDVNIKKIAYEKYKLDWMLHHGYTLANLMDELDSMQEESEDTVSQLFIDWEYGFGFGSEIWVCFNEFIDNEYQDKGYMKQLLNWEEYAKYEEDIK